MVGLGQEADVDTFPQVFEEVEKGILSHSLASFPTKLVVYITPTHKNSGSWFLSSPHHRRSVRDFPYLLGEEGGFFYDHNQGY